MRFILAQMLTGLFQGFGFEISFLFLWLVWKLAHSKLAHKISTDHWFHTVAEYFN